MGLNNYKIYKIPKGNGKFRLIADPSEAIRKDSNEYLTLLNEELNNVKIWNSHHGQKLYAYIPNRNCKDLVNDIYKFVDDCKEYDIFSIDIKDYFGSITKHQVREGYTYLNEWALTNSKILGPNLSCSATWSAIWDLIHPDQKPFKTDIGIAQGNPLSPLVANLVGIAYIDRVMHIFLPINLKTSKVAYFRYSDNIYVVAKRHETYSRDRLFRLLTQILENNVRLKQFKYTITVRGNHAGNTILGIRMGATRAQLSDKRWLRNVLHRVNTIGPAILQHADIQNRFGENITWDLFQLKLAGLMNYATHIDPTVEDLVKKYTPELLEDENEGL